MSFDFSTSSHAKWILTGEHAVLRDKPAIVYPLKNYQLHLHFCEDATSTDLSFHGVGEDWHIVFRGILEKGYALIDKPTTSITGRFQIENDIPLGVGLGGSAALCVAIARWFLWKKWIQPEQLYEFARKLEDNFHRDSSGIDIAGSMSDHGVYFTREGKGQPLKQNWQPLFYLSSSEQSSMTSQAVQKVQLMHNDNPKLAKEIDAAMGESTIQAKQALERSSTDLATLIKAIHLGKTCFIRWGLTGGKVGSHMQALMDSGAIACKPTGSGDGGYVLSLWAEEPPAELGLHPATC